MKHFESLENVLDYIHEIFGKVLTKNIRKVDPERLIEWYIAAQHYVSERITIYAAQLGYLDKVSTLRTKLILSKQPISWLGRCYHNGGLAEIEINIELLINCNLNRVLYTLIHELCHIDISKHDECFYKLQLANMQKVGILPKSIPFENVFQKAPMQRREDETIYYPIGDLCYTDGDFCPYSKMTLEKPKVLWRNLNMSEKEIRETDIQETIYEKYLKFRQHKIFTYYSKYGGFRSLNAEYIDFIKKYANEYNVDLREILIG